MEQKSIIIFKVKKEILSCPSHVSYIGGTFIFLETCANCRMCHEYIFLVSLKFKPWKKCVMNTINDLDIILKKCRTWTLKHSCTGPNHSFFYFVLLFWGGFPWNWCMIYLFLDSLTFKIWKKCVTNIISVLDII